MRLVNLAGRHARRTAELPLNTGTYFCGMCWRPPGKPHALSCPEVTPAQARAFLAYPDEARVFRGVPVGIALSLAFFWAPLTALALIWSH